MVRVGFHTGMSADTTSAQGIIPFALLEISRRLTVSRAGRFIKGRRIHKRVMHDVFLRRISFFDIYRSVYIPPARKG